MFSLDFIFISITFIILLVVSIKIGSPKVAIPLVCIYFFLILKNLLVSSREENPSSISYGELYTDEIQEDAKINKKISPLTEQNNIVKIQETQEKSKVVENKKSLKEKRPKKTEEKKLPKVEKKPPAKSPNNVKKTNDIKKKEILNNLISLKEIKICKNIKNRNPIGIGEIFPNSVDSLYCFTKIENLGKKMEVRHVWYYENQIMTQVRYNVKKSNVYRSWTKKNISSFQIGNWRVEVQDRNGTIIGSKRFKIRKSL